MSSVVSPAKRLAIAQLPSGAANGLLCWQVTSLQQLSRVSCVIFFCLKVSVACTSAPQPLTPSMSLTGKWITNFLFFILLMETQSWAIHEPACFQTQEERILHSKAGTGNVCTSTICYKPTVPSDKSIFLKKLLKIIFESEEV